MFGIYKQPASLPPVLCGTAAARITPSSTMQDPSSLHHTLRYCAGPQQRVPRHPVLCRTPAACTTPSDFNWLEANYGFRHPLNGEGTAVEGRPEGPLESLSSATSTDELQPAVSRRCLHAFGVNGGLNEKCVPGIFMYLNTWSPTGGAIWEGQKIFGNGV